MSIDRFRDAFLSRNQRKAGGPAGKATYKPILAGAALTRGSISKGAKAADDGASVSGFLLFAGPTHVYLSSRHLDGATVGMIGGRG